MSKRTHGQRYWYCRWHAEHLDDPAACAQILEDMLENGVPEIVDWRDQLIVSEMERLGLLRRPDESRDAYRARCREMRHIAREQARRFVQHMRGGSPAAKPEQMRSEQDAVVELYEERRAILEAEGLSPEEAHRQALISVAGVKAA